MLLTQPRFGEIPFKDDSMVEEMFRILDARCVVACWKSLVLGYHINSQKYNYHVTEALSELIWPLEYNQEAKFKIDLDLEGSFISKADLK